MFSWSVTILPFLSKTTFYLTSELAPSSQVQQNYRQRRPQGQWRQRRPQRQQNRYRRYWYNCLPDVKISFVVGKTKQQFIYDGTGKTVPPFLRFKGRVAAVGGQDGKMVGLSVFFAVFGDDGFPFNAKIRTILVNFPFMKKIKKQFCIWFCSLFCYF